MSTSVYVKTCVAMHTHANYRIKLNRSQFKSQ